MKFLLVVGGIIFVLFVLFCFALLIVGLQYLVFFNWRSCKYCKHTMEYKGLKDDDANGHYLFYCPKCGAWEQVPREEFFRQCDNPIDET